MVKTLAYRSLLLFKELLGKLNVEHSNGVIALFTRRGDAEAHVKLHGGRLIEGSEVRAYGFEGFEAGVLAEDEIAVDPLGLLDALKASLSEHEVLEDLVVGLRSAESGVEVALEKGGSLRFDSVIIASGAWTSRILGKLDVRLPLKPARGLAFLLETPRPPVGVPAILEDYGIVVAPVPRGFTRISSFFELKGFSLEWSSGRIEWLKSVLSKHVPNLRGYEAREIQTGFRPCTPDMLPVIGELPNHRNVYIVTGHCRLGVTLAPVTGELVVSMILNVKPAIPEDVVKAVSPRRFIGKQL